MRFISKIILSLLLCGCAKAPGAKHQDLKTEVLAQLRREGSDTAKSHMESNGGSLYAPRSTALAKGEQCMLCHANGKVADIQRLHPKQ